MRLALRGNRSDAMSQNVFLDSGFNDEDATVYALEAECAATLAKFIEARFPRNQRAAARHLGVHQSEVSALLSGSLGRRFSLSKLIRLARRAGLRFYIDMGDDATGASACVLRPNIVEAPGNRVEDADLNVEVSGVGTLWETANPRSATKTKELRH
jgi:predicted XRE-type DNA-binding protein